MEALIEQGQVWFPPDQRVERFDTLQDLHAAIDARDIPFSGSTPLLTRDTPDLAQWVGRRIGYGRPRLKKFKDGLKNENAPISSWLTPRAEADTVGDALNLPIVGATDEGSRVLKEVMGDKAFPYPKPLSLIKNLLAQATRPGDTVLDFFAGSGTTGQAVLELNAEDGGSPLNPRRFILCSSTEATAREPDKNLCRDVCAERLRRVIAGYGDRPGHALAQGGEFAYLQLDKVDGADLLLDAQPQHAATLLCLRNTGLAPVDTAQSAIQLVAKDADWLLVLCQDSAPATLEALRALHQQHDAARLLVVTPRPEALALWLQEQGIAGQTQSLRAALAQGQEQGYRSRVTIAP
ncbi:adenine-specific DNA-methyltransferase [Oryzisolibacter propanilivorax]|uniref:site-specific DNA-methyltransferase (adenine-specific) n=1 Tax=Oryzisolibacter propanilivorax TaxID=1527607 RepID=A0A1G9RS06_9BURK|nr:adenine-specific DNA-methyltransferase [Oryzisolibacter propanilivorax]